MWMKPIITSRAGREAFHAPCGCGTGHGSALSRFFHVVLLLAVVFPLKAAGQGAEDGAAQPDTERPALSREQAPDSAPAGPSGPGEGPQDAFFLRVMLPGAGLLVLVFSSVLIAVLYPRRTTS